MEELNKFFEKSNETPSKIIQENNSFTKGKGFKRSYSSLI